MRYFFTRWLAQNLSAFIVLITLSFLLLRGLPGDPLDALYSGDLLRDFSTNERLNLKESLGWDGHVWQQYLRYILQLLQGDLGYSYHHAAPVSELLVSSLPWSLALVLVSLPLSLLLGILPGLYAGHITGRLVDRILIMVATFLSSLPSFALGMILLSFFAFHLKWFPFGGGSSWSSSLDGWRQGLDWLWHGFLPACVLAVHGALRFFYLSRGLAQQIAQRPFLIAAQAQGASQWVLLRYHYWPNAWPELLTRMTSVLPGVLGSTLFVEVVFSYPGVGLLLVNALQQQDFVVVQGVLIVTGLVMLLVNSLIDLQAYYLSQRG